LVTVHKLHFANKKEIPSSAWASCLSLIPGPPPSHPVSEGFLLFRALSVHPFESCARRVGQRSTYFSLEQLPIIWRGW